jgi:hypothetical protein
VNLREGMVWMEQTRGWHQRPYLARMILKEVMETVRRVVMVMLLVIWVVEGVVVVGVVDVVVVDVVVVDGEVVGLVVAGKAKIDSLLGVVAGIVLVNGVGKNMKMVAGTGIMMVVMETVRRVVMVMLMVIVVVEGVVVVGVVDVVVVDVVVVDVVVVDVVVVDVVVVGKTKLEQLLGGVMRVVLMNGEGKDMKMVARTGLMRVEGVLEVMIAAGLLLVTGGVHMVVAGVAVSGLAEVVAVAVGVVQLEVAEVAVDGGVELLTTAAGFLRRR